MDTQGGEDGQRNLSRQEIFVLLLELCILLTLIRNLCLKYHSRGSKGPSKVNDLASWFSQSLDIILSNFVYIFKYRIIMKINLNKIKAKHTLGTLLNISCGASN